MNFRQILEKVESSIVFKNFKEKYSSSELVAGFFIIDFLSNDNKNALDYKTDGKIFTFDVENNGEIVMREDRLIEVPGKPPLQKINPFVKIEVEDLKGITEIQALDNGIHSKFSKIIAVLQTHEESGEKKQIWNLTCMLEGLIILNILIDSETGKVIKFERKSMMDLVRKK